jgi:hypothetical protein
MSLRRRNNYNYEHNNLHTNYRFCRRNYFYERSSSVLFGIVVVDIIIVLLLSLIIDDNRYRSGFDRPFLFLVADAFATTTNTASSTRLNDFNDNNDNIRLLKIAFVTGNEMKVCSSSSVVLSTMFVCVDS